MNKALIVLSACVDVRSGKRFERGDEFSPAPNHEQAKRLVAAGCLPEDAIKASGGPKTDAERALEEKAVRDRAEEVRAKNAADAAKAKRLGGSKTDPARIATQQINEDGLFDRTDDELTAIADAEKIDLAGATERDQIVAAIRAARAKA